MKTPTPKSSKELDRLRDLVHEMLAQPPALVTREDIKYYLDRLEAYVSNRVVEELRSLLLTTKCCRPGCTINHRIKFDTIQECINQLKQDKS